MRHKSNVVLRVVIGLLGVCLIGVVATYVVLRPARANGPGSQHDTLAEPDSDVALPNPASAYCEEKGHRLELREAADGSEYVSPISTS